MRVPVVIVEKCICMCTRRTSDSESAIDSWPHIAIIEHPYDWICYSTCRRSIVFCGSWCICDIRICTISCFTSYKNHISCRDRSESHGSTCNNVDMIPCSSRSRWSRLAWCRSISIECRTVDEIFISHIVGLFRYNFIISELWSWDDPRKRSPMRDSVIIEYFDFTHVIDVSFVGYFRHRVIS